MGRASHDELAAGLSARAVSGYSVSDISAERRRLPHARGEPTDRQRPRLVRGRRGLVGADDAIAAKIASAWRREAWSSSRNRAMLTVPGIAETRARSADHTSAG